MQAFPSRSLQRWGVSGKHHCRLQEQSLSCSWCQGLQGQPLLLLQHLFFFSLYSSSASVLFQPLFSLEACKHICRCTCERTSALSLFGEVKLVLHVPSSSWAGKRIYCYYCYYSYGCYSDLLMTVALIGSASVPYNPLSCFVHTCFVLLSWRMHTCTWHKYQDSSRLGNFCLNKRVCLCWSSKHN